MYLRVVLDAAGRLVGIVSLRELILAAPKTKLAEFMNSSVISVNADTDQEEVADFPVRPCRPARGGWSGRMVGIITVDDVLDVVEEATEDIQLLGGSQPLRSLTCRPVFSLYRKRIGWLLVLL